MTTLERLQLRVADLERRVAAVLREGTVARVELDPYRVAVAIDDDPELVTEAWPVALPATGRVWAPLKMGAPVLLLTPGGNGAPLVLPAAWNSRYEAPSEADAERKTLLQGQEGDAYVEVGDDGSITISADSITLDGGAVEIRGSSVDFTRAT